MKYTKWENVCIRTSANGIHFLLQKRVLEDGEYQFVNRLIDKLPSFTSVVGYELFHGQQTLPEIL